MDSSSSARLVTPFVLAPEAITPSHVTFKGINCNPIAYRILQENAEEPSSKALENHEIETWVQMGERQQKIALNIESLTHHLGLTLDQIKKVVEKAGHFDIQKIVAKSEKYKRKMQETGLTASEICKIKNTAKFILSKAPKDMLCIQASKDFFTNKKITILICPTTPNHGDVLVKVRDLGKGFIGQATEWVDLKTLDRFALKTPKDSSDPEQRKTIEEEAALLFKISEEISFELSSFPPGPLGLQMPPRQASPIEVLNLDSTPHISSTTGFIGRLYKGDLLHLYDALTQQQRFVAAAELTFGLELLHEFSHRIHGDIKLENVFVDSDYNHFYLADLGDGKTIEERRQIYQESLTAASEPERELLIDKLCGISTFIHHADATCLSQALHSGHIEEFHNIKAAGDVYALGILLLCLFNKKAAERVSHCMPRSSKKMDRLIQNILAQLPSPFEGTSLTQVQQDCITQMLYPTWNLRPKAYEIAPIFQLI